MYYKSVNRGVSFTKAGRYTIGLVVLLGLIATGSSYNALYLALSLGMGILIISGLQSEKVMKHYRLESLSSKLTEADSEFSIDFYASNQSRAFYIYGVENLVVDAIPKFKLMFGELPSLAKSTVLSLPAGKSSCHRGRCRGLARGYYTEFIVVQRTAYPFGLLTKFKVSPVPASVHVVPKWDQVFAEIVREQLQKRILGSRAEEQFYSHRNYLTGDSLRHVDWKKSAGLQTKDWSLKTYQPVGEQWRVVVLACWDELLRAANEKDYESYLSRLRTALEVIEREERQAILSFDHQQYVVGAEQAVKSLSALPRFERKESAKIEGESKVRGSFLILRVGRDQHDWQEDVSQVA